MAWPLDTSQCPISPLPSSVHFETALPYMSRFRTSQVTCLRSILFSRAFFAASPVSCSPQGSGTAAGILSTAMYCQCKVYY